MPHPEQSSQNSHVNFRDLRYGLLPVGELLIRLTEVSGDVHTQEGLSKASAMLSQRGMVVLDAHLAPFDIIATSIALSEGLKVRSCVAPVSAYDYYFPIIRRGFFSRLGKINGVELFPVYRDQDLEHWKNKPFQPPKQDWRQRREAVLSYYRRSLSAVAEPGSLVVVAAYNGVNRLGEDLANGVSRLLKSGSPALCSVSRFDQKSGKFRLFTAEDLLEFPQEVTRNELHRAVHTQHREILGRIGAMRGAGEIALEARGQEFSLDSGPDSSNLG